MFKNFSYNRVVYDNVEKYGTARQSTDDNTMLRRQDAVCIPDN